jgi:hypothetical protein
MANNSDIICRDQAELLATRRKRLPRTLLNTSKDCSAV